MYVQLFIVWWGLCVDTDKHITELEKEVEELKVQVQEKGMLYVLYAMLWMTNNTQQHINPSYFVYTDKRITELEKEVEEYAETIIDKVVESK